MGIRAMSSKKMPSYVGVYTEYDYGADGTISSRSSEQSTYDRRGNLTSRVTETDWDVDGTIDSRSSEQSTYDRRGNLTSRVFEGDWDGDGTIERYLTRYEYDNKSNVIGAFPEENPGAGGSIASLSADLVLDQPLLQ